LRLWSLQPLEIAEKVASGERFVADPKLAECYNLDESFMSSYHWLVSFMEESIPKPKDVEIPIWAWHTNYGSHQRPDRRRGMFNNYSERDAILELEVPDNLVTLTDFDDWHCILNNFPIFSQEEELLAEAGTWPKGYDDWEIPIYDENFKLESWKRVARSNGEFVQACFWAIEPEYFVKIHRLRRKK
jgi:hypothetical protein